MQKQNSFELVAGSDSTKSDPADDQPPDVPVIVIDGGVATGKSTAANGVAHVLGWRRLPSGSLYRACALHCMQTNIASDDVRGIAESLKDLDLKFNGSRLVLADRDVTDFLEQNEVSKFSSCVSKVPEVRRFLDQLQLDQRQAPGLVADGRDMGEIFDTPFRFYIETDDTVSVDRRAAQLKAKGESVDRAALLHEIQERNKRDRTRLVAPLKPHPNAVVIDNTRMKLAEVIQRIVYTYQLGRGLPPGVCPQKNLQRLWESTAQKADRRWIRLLDPQSELDLALA